jgi:hypothetical protein
VTCPALPLRAAGQVSPQVEVMLSESPRQA